MGCPCKVTSAFLAYIGAPMSAAMHREPYTIFTRDQWLEHFREEEEMLFPLFLKHGMSAAVTRIRSEHDRFRSLPAFPTKELKAHARFEDEAVLSLIRAMGIPEEQIERWRS